MNETLDSGLFGSASDRTRAAIESVVEGESSGNSRIFVREEGGFQTDLVSKSLPMRFTTLSEWRTASRTDFSSFKPYG